MLGEEQEFYLIVDHYFSGEEVKSYQSMTKIIELSNCVGLFSYV